jgi:hypothetical protein
MPLKLTSAILASTFLGQSVETGSQDRLECFLNAQSWICREEICAFGTTLHQGKTQRLFVNFAKSTLDLNGIPGTLDSRQVPAVVHWRLAILGQHTLSRHEAGGRTFVTLFSSSRSATFACDAEGKAASR